MKTRILVLSGPNLQLLGTREPEIYGKDTLADVHKRLKARAAELGASVAAFQSNHEGDLLDRIGKAALPSPRRSGASVAFEGMLINAGALTHTSLALHDALKAVPIPCIEVHISNPEAREAYRRESKMAAACLGKVSGFGVDSYILALEGLLRFLARRQP